MTCTVEITLHALSQRSPAESIGKGQKLIEAARPEGAEALSPGQRPGFLWVANLAPCKGKSFKNPDNLQRFYPFRACWVISIVQEGVLGNINRTGGHAA